MGEAKFTKGPYFAKEVTGVGGMYSVTLGDNGFNESGDYMQVHLCESNSNAKHVANLFAAAPEMYEMLESVKGELFQLIDEVNDQRMSRVNSQTETQPDMHDQETLYLIDKLLAKARGEA